MPDAMRVVLHNIKNLTDDRFVQGQERVAHVIQRLGRHRLEDLMLFTAFEDISAPLTEAATRFGIDAQQLADNARAIIGAIPSRWVEMKLRQQRQANPQKVWQGNDLNDVTALAIAVPYCDMVVIERSWSAMLAAAKVPERFGPTVTPRLQDVADRLT
jgi:hypothetical protein